MRIMTYPVHEGKHVILVLPGRNAHLSPILLRGEERGVVLEQLAETIRTIRSKVLVQGRLDLD